MTMLNLVGFPVDLVALHRLAEQRGLVRHQVMDEGRVLHHLLGETFGPGALQPFRLLPRRGGRSGMLYAYTRNDPADLKRMAETVALPESQAVMRVRDVQSRPLPNHLFAAGRILGFDILLRPVVRVRERAGARNAGAERDVYQVKAEQAFPDHRGAMAGSGATRESIYVGWLQARLGGAADLLPDKTRLNHFQRRHVLRGGRAIEGPHAVLHGTLRIGDPALFYDCLARGVGRHRAYGYGMLLLRPPQRC